MIEGRAFSGDLILFDLLEFDVILGMNCLIAHGVHVNYKTLKVSLKDLGGREVFFYGSRGVKQGHMISAIKCKLLKKGSIGY